MNESGEGTLFIGDDAPQAPPTNPEIGYPETAFNGSATSGRGLFGGVFYRIQSAQVLSNQLRFFVDAHDAFARWCELQTPLADPVGNYGCLPTSQTVYMSAASCSYRVGTDPAQPIDCDKLMLCTKWHACACDERSCTATEGFSVTVTAKFQASSDELEGTILLPNALDSATTLAPIQLERSVMSVSPAPDEP